MLKQGNKEKKRETSKRWRGRGNAMRMNYEISTMDKRKGRKQQRKTKGFLWQSSNKGKKSKSLKKNNMKGKFSAGKDVGERRIASLHVDLFLFFYSFPFFSFPFLIFFFCLSIFYLTLNFKSHSISFKSIFKENDSLVLSFTQTDSLFRTAFSPLFPIPWWADIVGNSDSSDY